MKPGEIFKSPVSVSAVESVIELRTTNSIAADILKHNMSQDSRDMS